MDDVINTEQINAGDGNAGDGNAGGTESIAVETSPSQDIQETITDEKQEVSLAKEPSSAVVENTSEIQTYRDSLLKNERFKELAGENPELIAELLELATTPMQQKLSEYEQAMAVLAQHNQGMTADLHYQSATYGHAEFETVERATQLNKNVAEWISKCPVPSEKSRLEKIYESGSGPEINRMYTQYKQHQAGVVKIPPIPKPVSDNAQKLHGMNPVEFKQRNVDDKGVENGKTQSEIFKELALANADKK
jgi:hypothetical protein